MPLLSHSDDFSCKYTNKGKKRIAWKHIQLGNSKEKLWIYYVDVWLVDLSMQIKLDEFDWLASSGRMQLSIKLTSDRMPLSYMLAPIESKHLLSSPITQLTYFRLETVNILLISGTNIVLILHRNPAKDEWAEKFSEINAKEFIYILSLHRRVQLFSHYAIKEYNAEAITLQVIAKCFAWQCLVSLLVLYVRTVFLPSCIFALSQYERKRQIKMHDHHQRHHNCTGIVVATSIHFGHNNIKLQKKKKLFVRPQHPQSAHHNDVCEYKPKWKTLYMYFCLVVAPRTRVLDFCWAFVRRCRDH